MDKCFDCNWYKHTRTVTQEDCNREYEQDRERFNKLWEEHKNELFHSWVLCFMPKTTWPESYGVCHRFPSNIRAEADGFCGEFRARELPHEETKTT